MCDDGVKTCSVWAVVVFASRESVEELVATMDSIHAKLPPKVGKIEIFINGNSGLAREFLVWLNQSSHTSVRLWSIDVGDKANAWNQYFHTVWSGEELVFFMDGYVRVNSNALDSLGSLVMNDAVALGGTGVPTVGRTAAASARIMLRDGGFHGNLCCMKGSAVSEMKARDLRLPSFMYRVDSLVGSLLHFAFDSRVNKWDVRRVLVDGNASWTTEPKHWWRWRDVVSKCKRSVRQARGLVENAAIKAHLVTRKDSVETLPRQAHELLRSWCADHPKALREMILRNPLVYLAMRDLPVAAPLELQHMQAKLLWPAEQRHDA
jgi:hypothetical protein